MPDVPDNVLPKLEHGLERVLFNPGVHYLKDPRSNVYNFDPYLRFITPPANFNFDAVSAFCPPSNDQVLHKLAHENQTKFTGSTSSTSASLSKIYQMLSDNQGVSLESLTGTFQSRPSRFTKSSRDFPAMITAMPQENGVFSIDMFDPVKRETVLSLMGTSMEYFLTQRPDIFARLLKGSEGPPPTIPDLYAYCQFDDLLLRSQLDCANSHLPRKYFDIKTRATMAIRYNVGEYQQFVDYRIHKSDGFFNSFNREFYDMMRSAFLKYSFQVRIGDMDGLFIAFHNTDEIFGFQYVSREDMDYILFGSPGAGNMYFSSCLQIFSYLLNLAAAEFDGQPFRMLSKRGKMGGLDVYAEMISNKEAAYERHEIKPSGIRKWSIARDKVSKDSQVEIDDDQIKENFSQHPSQPSGINCISYTPNHDLCAEYIKQRERYIKSIEGSGSPQETEKMLQWLSKYFSSIDTSHPVVFPLSRPE